MTHIYVAVEGEYGDQKVRAAFDSEEDAEKYAELFRGGGEVHAVRLHNSFPEVITTLSLGADIYPSGETKNTYELERMADGKDPIKEGSTSLRFEGKMGKGWSMFGSEPDTTKPYVQVHSKGTDHEAVRADFRKRVNEAVANPLKVTVDF